MKAAVSSTVVGAIAASALVLLAPAVGAGVYKWVDEKGRTVYSDQLPPGKAA